MSRSHHHACGRNCIVCHYEPARNKRDAAGQVADVLALDEECEPAEPDDGHVEDAENDGRCTCCAWCSCECACGAWAGDPCTCRD